MQQKINLYPLLAKKSGFELTRQTAFSIYGLFLSFLMISYGAALWKKHALSVEYKKLNTQVSVLQQQLTALTQQYPISEENALKESIDSLEQQVESKTKILNLLNSKANFSNYLLGLANVYVPDTWLSEISFNNPEHTINLKGYVLQSELVQKLIEQLNNQAAFSGLKFEVENITETPLPPSFQLSAKQENPG